MNTVDIAVDLIDDTKMDPNYRTMTLAMAESLAQDIEMQGLTHPITVRRDLENERHYILVAGQHRLKAVKILGWETIPCVIKEEIDEEQALMISITENFLRGQLNAAQQGRSVKRYEAYFMKWMAENKPETSPRERKKEFKKRLIESTKKAERTIKYVKHIADAFLDEELEILEHLGLSQDKLLELANLNEQARRQAVSLLAMGADIEEVLKQIVISEEIPDPEILKELKREQKKYGKSGEPIHVSESTKKTPACHEIEAGNLLPEVIEETEESDEEWLQNNCSYLSQHLQSSSSFNGDALLYRYTREIRKTFREEIKKDLEEAKKGCHGSFYRLVEKLVNISHPKDWHLCGDCQGGGCRSCSGGGYWITSEEYK